MGITRLMNLLREKCPEAIKNIDLKTYTGRTVACDASMTIYQFLISTQHVKTGGFGISELRDNDGNLTGHLLGLFNRSIMLMENGIKPCWVFDGKPPDAKNHVLKERKKRKEEAEANKSQAKEDGDMEKLLKLAGQSIKIDAQMTADAKELVKLLGLPMIEAPAEAEAQCSIMAKDGVVYAVATEDMDCLTFGCPVLLRDLNNKEEPVIQIQLEKVLKGLELTMDEFIDLCILCGCDYSGSIDGIGSIKAHKLITEHKTIENVLEYVKKYNEDSSKKKKLTYDEGDFNYVESRELFKHPDVIDPKTLDLKWTAPDYEGLKKFLIDGKGFNSNRIESAMKRIESAKHKANQSRLENFFQLKTPQTTTNPVKRKAEDDLKHTTANKKKKVIPKSSKK